MKRYVFCYDDYPLGQIQFDEKNGIGNFTYVYSSSAPEFVKIKPETVVALLEEIRYDAQSIKTISEFEKYIKFPFGKFHYVALKGYE